jgi:hypothetical protein
MAIAMDAMEAQLSSAVRLRPAPEQQRTKAEPAAHKKAGLEAEQLRKTAEAEAKRAEAAGRPPLLADS